MMNDKNITELVLLQQNEGVKITKIASNLELTAYTLKKTMKEQGFEYKDGIFVSDETMKENLQVSLLEENSSESKGNKKNTKKDIKKLDSEGVFLKELEDDIPVRVTKETLDTVHELRDWYLSIKDSKKLKNKVTSKTTEVHLDDKNDTIKSIRVKMEEDVFEKVGRLAENCGQSLDDIISQAIKDLLVEYAHLI